MGRELPYKTRKYIRAILMALCAAALVLYVLVGGSWTTWTLIGVFAVYCIFHMVLWRCPACGASLGNMPRMNNCYKCGEPLEEE